MARCVSPLHVHVGSKTPVHVHLSKKGLSKAERLEISCSEMSAGRPGLRATAGKRGSHWGAGSATNHTPWVPPPGKSSSKSRLAWEGPTHRLEITPGGVRDSAVLRVSDLSGDDLPNDILVEREDPLSDKLQSLKAEVDQLKNEVDLERSLRDLEESENALRESRMSLRDRDDGLARCKEELVERELENVRLSLDKVRSASRSSSPTRPLSSEGGRPRERLCSKLLELEVESSTLNKRVDKFRESIRSLQKDRRFYSVYASDVVEKKKALLDTLAVFESRNKALRKMLRNQQAIESNEGTLSEQNEVLQRQISEADSTNQLLRSRLDESERLAMHSQTLHDQLGLKDSEIQGLNIRLQSLEEQLRSRDHRCVELESSLSDHKRKSQLDKELLKRATKQHRERAVETEQTASTLKAQLEVANAQLEQSRTKLSSSVHSGLSHQAQVRSLESKVRELQDTLDLAKATSKSSVNAVSSRLLEKTQELNSANMEIDGLQSTISALEAKLKSIECSSKSKQSSLETELSQLHLSIRQYENLVAEYKGQINSVRAEIEERVRESRAKESEVERVRQEGVLETEKAKLVYQHQLSDLEATKEQLKVSEVRLRDAQDRLASHEQRSVEQTKTVAELTARLDQAALSIDELKEKWNDASCENKAIAARLEMQERRVSETEQQNKELMEIVSKKEDDSRRLQSRVDELLREVSSVSSQHELSRSEYRRQLEQVKDRGSTKDRANLSRIADLESQLSRANAVSSQLRKSKEDGERRYQSKVHELQDRLDQANSTKRSMENYTHFLKSSYASVFSDVGGSPTSSRRNPLIH